MECKYDISGECTNAKSPFEGECCPCFEAPEICKFARAEREASCVNKCAVCGKEFKCKNARKMYCSDECKHTAILKMARAYNALKKAEHKEVSCIICGKKFVQKKVTHLTCSDECRKIHNKRHDAEKRRERKKLKSAEKAAAKKKVPLDKVNEAAREAHMSYGQYVAMQQKGREKRK